MSLLTRLTRTEWAAVAVLVMSVWYGTQWLAQRDTRLATRVSIGDRLDVQERKLDALFTWADLVSQIEGWPRPRIPERPIALPKPQEEPAGPGPFAAQFPPQTTGGCP